MLGLSGGTILTSEYNLEPGCPSPSLPLSLLDHSSLMLHFLLAPSAVFLTLPLSCSGSLTAPLISEHGVSARIHLFEQVTLSSSRPVFDRFIENNGSDHLCVSARGFKSQVFFQGHKNVVRDASCAILIMKGGLLGLTSPARTRSMRAGPEAPPPTIRP